MSADAWKHFRLCMKWCRFCLAINLMWAWLLWRHGEYPGAPLGAAFGIAFSMIVFWRIGHRMRRAEKPASSGPSTSTGAPP